MSSEDRTTLIHLSSASRADTNPSRYTVFFQSPLRNVSRVEVVSYDLPWPTYNVNLTNNRVDFVESTTMTDIDTLPVKSVYIPAGMYATTRLANVLSIAFADALAAGYMLNTVTVSVNNNTLKFTYRPDSTMIALVFMKSSPARGLLGIPRANYSGAIADLNVTSKFVAFFANGDKIVYQITVKDFYGNIRTDKGDVPKDDVVGIAPVFIASAFQCNFDIDRSVAMIIPQLEAHDERTIDNNVEPFAIFHNNGTQSAFRQVRDFIHNTIPVLTRIDVSFLNVSNGELFDFQNRDHIVSLRFTHGSVRFET